jgi:hypothetical protein
VLGKPPYCISKKSCVPVYGMQTERAYISLQVI